MQLACCTFKGDLEIPLNQLNVIGMHKLRREKRRSVKCAPTTEARCMLTSVNFLVLSSSALQPVKSTTLGLAKSIRPSGSSTCTKSRSSSTTLLDQPFRFVKSVAALADAPEVSRPRSTFDPRPGGWLAAWPPIADGGKTFLERKVEPFCTPPPVRLGGTEDRKLEPVASLLKPGRMGIPVLLLLLMLASIGTLLIGANSPPLPLLFISCGMKLLDRCWAISAACPPCRGGGSPQPSVESCRAIMLPASPSVCDPALML